MCDNCNTRAKILKFINPEFSDEEYYICSECGSWWE